MKGLVLGLGNDLLSDDGVGLLVVRELRERMGDLKGIDFVETNEMGLSLLDFLEGYDWAVIVDSIVTGEKRPGELHIFDRSRFSDPRAGNPHHMGLDEILALAKGTGIAVPEDIAVIAIEVKDPFVFGKEPSPEVQKALPRAMSSIERVIKGMLHK